MDASSKPVLALEINPLTECHSVSHWQPAIIGLLLLCYPHVLVVTVNPDQRLRYINLNLLVVPTPALSSSS